jgi:hypothetical protein
MPDGFAPPDIPPTLDRAPGPAALPVPDIPVNPPLILLLPPMPAVLDDGAPGMPPMPDDAPWGPAMPDMPDRTPSPATPRGRVAGMLDIPLLPLIDPVFGRAPGAPVPVPDGFAARGAVDRSPIPPMPLCCAQDGAAAIARANRRVVVQSSTRNICDSLTCSAAWPPRRVP